MRVRKNVLALTEPERIAFFQAMLMLKAEIANPAAPAADRLSTYDLYAAIHQAIFSVRTPVAGGGFTLVNGGHRGPAFGPWHRELLLRFELDLQRMVPGVLLPYWDWTDHGGTESFIFSDQYFGPNGGPAGVGGGTVLSGYFAFDAPGSGTNPTPPTGWWPTIVSPGNPEHGTLLPGWRISPLLEEGEGTALRRFFGNDEAGASPDPFAGLATQVQVNSLMQSGSFEAGASGFRGRIEGQTPFHNYVHRWVTGHMETGASPNDPIFFMHHCNIDRLWAMWQMDGHGGVGGYPDPALTSFDTGHNLNDRMWPWVGGAAGYSIFIAPAVIAALPNLSGEPERTPIDLINHRDIIMEISGTPTQLGYSYDTEVVVGVSLDQSFSMTGDTPDPMTGAGSVTKWDAARQGVTHFLQDCEAAYDAVEAYVVSGTQTFNTDAGLPKYTPVFPAAPGYGLIKSGGTYTAAVFTAAAGLMNPSGNTPLAGALIETEDDLVRPPFGNRPVEDLRYHYILTDGKRTAGPLLSSLAEPEFPHTTIFGMGFGVGSGWNGVDYATIQELTQKGRVAPLGVSQVFHGENAGAINKFFTNSIAATIGYTPVVDPTYELFPGEHSMTPFQVTSADSSLFISVVGFDYDDSNWAVSLLSPDGRAYNASTISPVFITVRQANGKVSIFLNRGSAAKETWVGRWYVMVTYKPRATPVGMVMFSPWQALIPTGAPPVRGPLFSRVKLQDKLRPTQRLSLPTAGNFAQPLEGVTVPPTEQAGSVAVDVYAKTSLRVGLDVDPSVGAAGDAISLKVRIESPQKGSFRDVITVGRLISPGFSIGNLIADATIIPLRERQKFEDVRTGLFDELSFLAEVEERRPEALSIRDRLLDFRHGDDDDTFVSAVNQTRYPGVYWVAARVDGIWEPDGGPPERFTRILSKQVALGIKIDPSVARPTLYWLDPNRFVIRLFAADALGNIASSTRMDPPIIQFRREALSATHRVSYDGWHELEVSLAGPSVRLASDGLSVSGGTVSCSAGGSRELDKPITTGITVSVGNTVLPVIVPSLIGDSTNKRVYEAGRAAARRIPLERRVAFESVEAAIAEGFIVARTTRQRRGRTDR